MKKIRTTFLIIITIFFAGIFASCNGQKKESSDKTKIKIIATTFPVYDWIKNITGNKAQVELLINTGTDLHSWQPAAKDILAITGKETDLFVYLGGESDFWVKKLIPQMEKNHVKYFSIMENNLPLLEPMDDHHHQENTSDAHEHHHSNKNTSEDFNNSQYDEHIWLSLKRVPDFVMSIANQIADLDKENAEYYLNNAKDYSKKIQALYTEALQVVENSKSKTIVIADRNPFVYLECDLGLKTFAAFHGCSSDTESSFDVILVLQKIVEENQIGTVVCADTENPLAKTIVNNVKARKVDIKILNSIQTKILESENYYSIMEWNVEQLKFILNN